MGQSTLGRVAFLALAGGLLASFSARSETMSDFRPHVVAMAKAAKHSVTIGDIECSEKARMACSLPFGTVGIIVGSLPDKKTVEFAEVICAKGCQPQDFVVAADLSIRLLTPVAASNKYDAWVPLIETVIADSEPRSTFVGSTKVVVSRIAGAAILLRATAAP